MSFYLLGKTTWHDLKRVRQYQVTTPAPYLPAPTITHTGGDYKLTLEILPDPRRDVLLIRYALEGPYQLVAIVAPHLGSEGTQNHAWIDADAAYAARGKLGSLLEGTRTAYFAE